MIPHEHRSEPMALAQLTEHIIMLHPETSASGAVVDDHRRDHIRAEREAIALSGGRVTDAQLAAIELPVVVDADQPLPDDEVTSAVQSRKEAALREVLERHVDTEAKKLDVPVDLVTGGASSGDALREYESQLPSRYRPTYQGDSVDVILQTASPDGYDRIRLQQSLRNAAAILSQAAAISEAGVVVTAAEAVRVMRLYNDVLELEKLVTV